MPLHSTVEDCCMALEVKARTVRLNPKPNLKPTNHRIRKVVWDGDQERLRIPEGSRPAGLPRTTGVRGGGSPPGTINKQSGV